MTKEEAAQVLNGSEYGEEGSKSLFAQMRDAGLVAVFGASDDLMEFRGAIYDEVGAWNGATANVDTEGLVPTFEDVSDNGTEAEVEAYFRRKPGMKPIKAVWSPDEIDASWLIKTAIPHATFDVMEDGDLYCRGIVFALADAA